MDLAYVPHHGNPYYTTVEFFKRIRARYYVFSGTDPNKDVFNALLEGKKSWENQDLGEYPNLRQSQMNFATNTDCNKRCIVHYTYFLRYFYEIIRRTTLMVPSF